MLLRLPLRDDGCQVGGEVTQLSRGDRRKKLGTAPLLVSIAVLWVEGFGLLLVTPLFGVAAEDVGGDRCRAGTGARREPVAVVAPYGRGPVVGSWQEILVWLLYASGFYCISIPAVLAAHRTVVRTDTGHRVRSAGQILGFGSLVLLVESVGA
ncbi:hypothetical protein GCM10009647_052990 [Streptomyces sanglieri]